MIKQCNLNTSQLSNLIFFDIIILIQKAMSFCERYERRRQNEKQQPSKVLLVCVYDTIILQITNEIIYEKFCAFGKIVKVLIFQKNQVTKFFIEFESLDQAINAKKALDSTKLCGTICKMNIYFSNFTNVDLKNQTSQGADFTLQECIKNEFIKKYDLLTKSSQSSNRDIIDDQLIMQSFNSFMPFYRSKTENPSLLTYHIEQAKDQSSQKGGDEEDEITKSIHSNINSILQSDSNSSKHEEDPQNNSKAMLLKEKSVAQSKNSILTFEMVNQIENRHVYNLFSNFGNIAYISKKKQRIYVKFRSAEFAAICSTYLSNFIFYQNNLHFEHPYEINESRPKQNEFCECTYYDNTYDRFTPQKSITINSPSQTLHISSLRREVCNESTLRSIFEDYGRVEAIQILKHSSDKNMALVKMASLQESFIALAQLHNEMLAGRKMQISFTKSRIQGSTI